MVKLNGRIFFIEDDEFLEKYNDIWNKVSNRHFVIIIGILIFSVPYSPAFELNTEIYSVSTYSVQMGKNTEQKNSKYGQF